VAEEVSTAVNKHTSPTSRSRSPGHLFSDLPHRKSETRRLHRVLIAASWNTCTGSDYHLKLEEFRQALEGEIRN